MLKTLNTIGVICRRDKPTIIETVHATLACLAYHNKTVLLDETTASILQNTSLKTLPGTQLANACDLLIIIGGDGSLLNAIHEITPSDTPILGVNRGTLGFLTDISPDTLTEQLADILKGHYTVEKRFLLKAIVSHHQQIIGEDTALNEVALLQDLKPHMVDFQVHVDRKFVFRERADGLLVATPTGSTAYALSGGGPILHPELDSIVLVPMFAHTLTSRPIVLSANHTVTIQITKHDDYSPRMSCDSRKAITVPSGGQISITKHPKRLSLMHPLAYDYFDTLRSKLHWGKKHYHED